MTKQDEFVGSYGPSRMFEPGIPSRAESMEHSNGGCEPEPEFELELESGSESEKATALHLNRHGIGPTLPQRPYLLRRVWSSVFKRRCDDA
jgi:hypothetical protein